MDPFISSCMAFLEIAMAAWLSSEFRLLAVMMATHGHVVRFVGAPKDHQPSGKPWVPAQLLELSLTGDLDC